MYFPISSSDRSALDAMIDSGGSWWRGTSGVWTCWGAACWEMRYQKTQGRPSSRSQSRSCCPEQSGAAYVRWCTDGCWGASSMGFWKWLAVPDFWFSRSRPATWSRLSRWCRVTKSAVSSFSLSLHHRAKSEFCFLEGQASTAMALLPCTVSPVWLFGCLSEKQPASFCKARAI